MSRPFQGDSVISCWRTGDLIGKTSNSDGGRNEKVWILKVHKRSVGIVGFELDVMRSVVRYTC